MAGTVNRDSANTPNTDGFPGGYYGYDLGPGNLASITDYTLRASSSTGGRYNPNFKLQGSNNVATNDATGFNAATWVDIDIRTGDSGLSVDDSFATYTCNQGNSNAYRWIRIYQSGVDSLGGNYITLTEVELYGVLSY